MKKITALLLTAALCVSLAACGGSQKAEETPTPTENTGSAGIQVDEGLFSVDITLPENFFEDMTEEEIKHNAEEKGISKCVVNEDGSVTYTMTKSRHNELLGELKANLEETISGLTEGEDAVASFVSVEYSDDFSHFDIEVNDQYSSWDSLYALTFYVSGAYYQAFAGKNAEEIDVVVNFIDSETQEVLSTASYREWLNNMQEGDEEADPAEEPEDVVGIPLAVGETITVDDECEFSLNYTNITKDVLPPTPGSWYSHYEAEAGKTYVDICVAYKNLAAREKAADEILSADLIYAGKYQYRGFSIIEEDSRSDFTYSNITNITADVLPPQPGDWYSHYQAEDGKVYVDFCVAYKNWNTRAVEADEVKSAVLTYAGKYEYKGFSMIEEDSRGDFTYSNITNIAPLATEYLHYLFEVPEDVESSGESIEIEFVIGGNTYSYKVR